MKQPLWGIDLGGTKIESVILPADGEPQPLFRQRINTEAAKGYQHIIEQIVQLTNQLKEASGLTPKTLGIGTPGVLDPTLQTMKNCNTTCLNGKPLKKDLEKALGLKVELANDANCFALAETKWGAAHKNYPQAQVVFGIIMGTGVGGGIVVNQKLWEGKHGIAGEWGHNFLDESGGSCYCGQTGCVETVLSGPALERYYHKISGTTLSLKEIYARHQTGSDPNASSTINRLCTFFGSAVSVITNLLDPDLIVVGGGVGNIPELYTAGKEALNSFIFNNRTEVPILQPLLGDSAGVFGAAALSA